MLTLKVAMLAADLTLWVVVSLLVNLTESPARIASVSGTN